MAARDALADAPLLDVGPDAGSYLIRRRAAQLVAANAVGEERRHPSGWARYWVAGHTVLVHTLRDGWTGRCTCAAAELCAHLLAAAHVEAATTGTPIPAKTRRNPKPPTPNPTEMEGFYD